MTSHRYSSFKEIDERLKILKLETQIDKESFKHDVLKFKKNITPAILSGGIGGMVQIAILTFITKNLSKIFRRESKD
ncbi:MAG: hypothetical protein KJN66_05835 [Bacteroidia bacterium]|nr:hypothetical protein [Bacteroidia bacterium]